MRITVYRLVLIHRHTLCLCVYTDVWPHYIIENTKVVQLYVSAYFWNHISLKVKFKVAESQYLQEIHTPNMHHSYVIAA